MAHLEPPEPVANLGFLRPTMRSSLRPWTGCGICFVATPQPYSRLVSVLVDELDAGGSRTDPADYPRPQQSRKNIQIKLAQSRFMVSHYFSMDRRVRLGRQQGGNLVRFVTTPEANVEKSAKPRAGQILRGAHFRAR